MRTVMERLHDDHTFFRCIKKAKMHVKPIKGNETYNITYRDLKTNLPGRPQNWEGNIKGFIILRFLLIILVILPLFSNILNIITSGLLFSLMLCGFVFLIFFSQMLRKRLGKG